MKIGQNGVSTIAIVVTIVVVVVVAASVGAIVLLTP